MEYQTVFDFQNDTSADYLYRSLGTFWTQIFQERDTIKGYTKGVAEEMVQRYIDLVELVNSYSVKNIEVFHKEKWKPITLYRSKLNQQPFVFEEGHAVFGAQPDLDEYYHGAVFQFGKAKTPTADVFSYYIGDEINSFGVLADKVLDPKVILTYGNDVKITDKALFFNSNIFDNPNVSKFQLIGENGSPVTYKDSQGNVLQEEGLILWAYNANIDKQSLYYNFGYIFNLNFENDQFFKDLLSGLFSINVDGPTVNAIKRCCAAFMEAPIVKNKVEVVESIFEDANYQYVVTDLECYKFSSLFSLASSVFTGATLHEGDIITTSIEFYDSTSAGKSVVYSPSVSSKGWWLTDGLIVSKLAVSKYLFYGKYTHQLLFSNELALISINAAGDLVFPVEGIPDDIDTFHNYINSTPNKETIKSTLGLVNPGDTYTIVPVNFLMENFLKNNTAMLKFSFHTDAQRSRFLSILPIIKSQLPPYVYLILKVDMQLASEDYSQLNDSISIEFVGGDVTLNADGSDESAMIESLDPYYYNDAKNRLFELSLAVKQDSENSLPMDYVNVEESMPVMDGNAQLDGRVLIFREGELLKPIPPGATTAQYRNLILLRFAN